MIKLIELLESGYYVSQHYDTYSCMFIVETMVDDELVRREGQTLTDAIQQLYYHPHITSLRMGE